MTLTRRAALALTAAACAVPGGAAAQTVPWVYALGNSFLGQHNVMTMLTHLMRAGDEEINLLGLTRSGAWLADHVAGGTVFRDLRQHPFQWIIMQDHSIAALSPKNRAKSRAAVEAILGKTEACPIYLTPWPRSVGHPLYAREGMPQTPAEMVERTTAHYTALAEEFGGTVAPVAESWLMMSESGYSFYAVDDYHANVEGAWFVAMILAATLGADPRHGSPPALASISMIARTTVTRPARCATPSA